MVTFVPTFFYFTAESEVTLSSATMDSSFIVLPFSGSDLTFLEWSNLGGLPAISGLGNIYYLLVLGASIMV